MTFLHRVVQEYPDACILLVTHGGVIRHIVEDILKVPASAVCVNNVAVLQLATSPLRIESMDNISIDKMR